MEPDAEGIEQLTIQHYTLNEGETLVDAAPPTYRPYAGAEGLINPRWDGSTAWAEAATVEDIAEWDAAHPAPDPAPPGADEINALAIAELSMAQAQQSAETNMAIAELSILIGGMGSV
ncbi:MAG: hypothetical protein ACK5L0_04920 [Candidatus Fimivivens sp.]